MERCRLCRRPLDEECIIIYIVDFVAVNRRSFTDADNQLVKLELNDLLCHHCVAEAKINTPSNEIPEEWVQDCHATKTTLSLLLSSSSNSTDPSSSSPDETDSEEKEQKAKNKRRRSSSTLTQMSQTKSAEETASFKSSQLATDEYKLMQKLNLSEKEIQEHMAAVSIIEWQEPSSLEARYNAKFKDQPKGSCPYCGAELVIEHAEEHVATAHRDYWPYKYVPNEEERTRTQISQEGDDEDEDVDHGQAIVIRENEIFMPDEFEGDVDSSYP